MSLLIIPVAGGDVSVVDVTITAGENLAIRDCVHISTGLSAETGGRAYKADASLSYASVRGWVFGFTTEAITSGNKGTVRIAGVLGGFSGLTAGLPQYVSTNPGVATEDVPYNFVFLGIAVSTTQILVNSRGSQEYPMVTVTKGYFAGGYLGPPTTITDKIVFMTDTTAAQGSANLSLGRSALAAVSEAATKGYFAGGYSDSHTTITDKIVFMTDTTAAQGSANLSVARQLLGGLSEGNSKGYFAGGLPAGPLTSVVDKIVFATDITAAQVSANLSVARSNTAGISEGNSKGYFAGGDTGVADYTAITDQITFSTDITAAQASANLSTIRGRAAGVKGDSTKGYFCGGFTGGYIAITDKIVFATDITAAQVSANLSVARYSAGGLSEGNSKGYVAGGHTGDFSAVADKIEFSTDTTSAQASANLSAARAELDALSEAVS